MRSRLDDRVGSSPGFSARHRASTCPPNARAFTCEIRQRSCRTRQVQRMVGQLSRWWRATPGATAGSLCGLRQRGLPREAHDRSMQDRSRARARWHLGSLSPRRRSCRWSRLPPGLEFLWRADDRRLESFAAAHGFDSRPHRGICNVSAVPRQEKMHAVHRAASSRSARPPGQPATHACRSVGPTSLRRRASFRSPRTQRLSLRTRPPASRKWPQHRESNRGDRRGADARRAMPA